MRLQALLQDFRCDFRGQFEDGNYEPWVYQGFLRTPVHQGSLRAPAYLGNLRRAIRRVERR